MSEASSQSPNLDKITKEFVENLESMDSKPLYEMTPDEARNFLLDIQRKNHTDIDADVTDIIIPTDNAGDVDVRFISPKNSSEILPLIIYIHGGGWILGDKESHDMLTRKLANCTNSVVAFVNYSRSPEAAYPVAINQIYGVLEYLYKRSDDFSIDPDTIAVAGDSAGANMAAVIALKSKKENGPKITFQALLYPVTDAAMNTESYVQFENGPWLTKKAMEWFWDSYIPDKSAREDIYVSPLMADISELKNLPPALIIVDENDVLRDEGEAYARKLDDAGVDVMSIRINNTHHDFLMLNALWSSNPTQCAFALLCKVLCDALHKH